MSWKDLRHKARIAVAKARPVTRAVERAANLAVHLRGGITPMGAIGLVSAAVNAIGDDLNASTAPQGCHYVACSSGTVAAALSAVGWVPAGEPDPEGEWTRLRLGDGRIDLHRDGRVYASDEATFIAMEVALDAHLPRAVRVQHAGEAWVDAPADLHHYETAHGAEIVRLLRMHVADGPRCVLLKGKPGTGKTTMAREIADRLAMGRIVFVDASAVSGGGIYSSANACGPQLQAIAALRPAVVVVDDIDKIEAFEAFGCGTVEVLRNAAQVVLLTANNGDLDTVIDGAVGRPGRIDEVFAIEAEPFPREAPFDLLTDDEWHDVQAWPVASVNELRRRLELRGRDGMRLDDLRERVGRRVRSGDVLA